MSTNPVSCDTFVVMADSTAKQAVVFGKNSDRPQGEVQEVVFVPKTSHGQGTKLMCTYIEIDQVEETRPVILSKPGWMWGAEMGSNDLGVVIGNEAVWSKYEEDSVLEPRLLGMDLLRLGLERGTSARDALDVITKLLEKHGQGGPCAEKDSSLAYFNSFLIADSSEAYVLETAGKVWAAEKVESGFRNISNCYSIGTKIDLMSENLHEAAKSSGLWDGVCEFNFAVIFSGEKNPLSNRLVAGKELLAKLSTDNKFDVSRMMTVLRDECSEICRRADNAFPTASSQVSVLSKKRPSCHWFTGTVDAKHSVFKPFVFTDSVTELTDLIRCPDDATDRRHALYKLHQDKYSLLTNPIEGAPLRELLNEVETNCINEVEEALDTMSPEDNLLDLALLFNDSVDAEARFYK
ncbi:Secernin-2 [Halotydeus destructor]|nr:Secernin-2 [Halotydeus destructor]